MTLFDLRGRLSGVWTRLARWAPSPLVRAALLVISAVAMVLGLGLTWFWLEKAVELEGTRYLSRNLPLLVLGFVAVATFTLFNLGLRWARWHFLIRRVGAYLGTKDSLLIYLSTVPAVITPFYLGELLRVVMLGKRYSRYRFDVAAIWLMERCSDLLALCLFLSWARGRPDYLLASALLWLCAVVLLRMIYRQVRGSEYPQPFTLAVLLLSSLAASILPGLALWAIARILSMPLKLVQIIDAFAFSTIFGNITGAPSGIGVTGSVLVLALQKSGVALIDAIEGTWIYRMGTVWLVIVLGTMIALTFRRRLLAIYREGLTKDHFDQIAEQYNEEIPSWIRDRLLTRKIGVMRSRLTAHGLGINSRGLDLGCGQGWHVCEIAQLGYQMYGVDQSEQQLKFAVRRAEERGLQVDLRVASVPKLPFPDNFFDFVYAINVFHHLTEDEARPKALEEIVRVLKPQGVFFLQEINTSNPLFRVYMGYLFPLIRGIDLGTEKWIRTNQLPLVRGAEWQKDCDYFTFLPDFISPWLLRYLEGIERFLEWSIFRKWSAHYVARLVKQA